MLVLGSRTVRDPWQNPGGRRAELAPARDTFLFEGENYAVE
jgi:hypothetical protein